MPFLATLLPRLRFALITATLLMVLGMNHQAVATLRVVSVRGIAQVAATPRTSVVKQRVTLEATSPLGLFVSPVADAWLPLPFKLPTRVWKQVSVTEPLPCPSAVPELVRSLLLLASLSPQAP